MLHENESSREARAVIGLGCEDMYIAPGLLSVHDPLFLYDLPEEDTTSTSTQPQQSTMSGIEGEYGDQEVGDVEEVGDKEEVGDIEEVGDNEEDEEEQQWLPRSCRAVQYDHVAEAVVSLCRAQGVHQLLLVYTGGSSQHSSSCVTW